MSTKAKSPEEMAELLRRMEEAWRVVAVARKEQEKAPVILTCNPGLIQAWLRRQAEGVQK